MMIQTVLIHLRVNQIQKIVARHIAIGCVLKQSWLWIPPARISE